MGEFLTSALNAIPGRTSDQTAHADLLSDPFVKPFVDAFATSRASRSSPALRRSRPICRSRSSRPGPVRNHRPMP